MRKLLLVLFVFMFISSAIFFPACNNADKGKEKETSETSSTDSLKKVIERGEYLVHNVAVCLDCHSERDPNVFSMPIKVGTEGGGPPYTFGAGMGVPGEISPSNITPYKLKDWSDDDILKAMTQGINKRGDTLFPLMPYHNYSRLAKDDLVAIIAYIRTLKPIERADGPKKLMIPASMFGPLPQNTLDQNKRPDPSDKVKYGEYLVTMASCSDCHTPMTQQGPDFSKMFAGGFNLKSDFVNVTTANITPDTATGIGSWTEEAFLAKFKANVEAAGKKVNPGKMNTEMPWAAYGKMKEEDLKAIYAFLRTVKPISNKVEKWPK
jgi:mono/diheme cytochrome c family protein